MPSSQKAEKTEYVWLKWSDKQMHIMIEDKDHDKYTRTVGEAIAACRAYERIAEFRQQFEALLNLLKKWLNERPDKVDKAFLTVRDRGLLFLVVTKEVRYDDKLEDELVELDLAIGNNNDFSEIDLEVLALPQTEEDNYGSFCYPEYTLKF